MAGDRDDYRILQELWVAENDIREGAKVRVTRAAEHGERGWTASWHPYMRALIGRERVVRGVTREGVRLRASGLEWVVPCFVLEVTRPAPPLAKPEPLRWFITSSDAVCPVSCEESDRFAVSWRIISEAAMRGTF